MPFKDALSQLPPFKWRSKPYEISAARYGYRHENAEHRVSFGNVELVEGLGRLNPTFSYTIPMRQGVAVGKYNSFTKITQLDADIRDRTEGPLVDPIWGEWTCRPVSFSAPVDFRSRDGVDVDVEFVWSPLIDDVIEIKGGIKDVGELAANAGRLDAEVSKVCRKYDVPSPQPSVDALSAISGVGDQLNRAGEKFGAAMDRFAYQVQKIEAVADNLINTTKDPDAYGVKRSSRKLRVSASRLKKQAQQSAKTTKQIIVAQNKHVLSVVRDSGMSLADLLQMNAALAANPIVTAGTVVNIHA